MDKNKCLFCNSENCTITNTTTGYTVTCRDCELDINLNWGFISAIESQPIYQKSLNSIVEKVLYEPFNKSHKRWDFYYDETEAECSDDTKINIFTLLKDYPENFIDILNKALLNLARRYPSFGEEFFVHNSNYRLFYPTNGTYDEAEGILQMLAQMGYVISKGKWKTASISAEGWKKIESLQKKRIELKQGFVAMRFGPITADIREGFRQAIINAGYTMRAIDEKEHNNQIVPEIFHEIDRSKFVVVDVTYPNYGAYYEAGYAYGLGKEVIVCCSKEAFENKDGKFERPHFDISQKSMVIWNDIEDLKTRLTKRIQATVK